MACNVWTAFLLGCGVLVASALCVRLSEARAVEQQRRVKRHMDIFADDDYAAIQRLRAESNGTNCFDAEPCQFGLYKRSHGRMYSFVLIPSWCVCLGSQKCAVDRYDQKKKAEIYTCQNLVRASI